MTQTLGKVVIGLSGGVDSAVAAYLLLQEGYEVVGVSLNLLSCNKPIERTCCAPSDRQDAREVCKNLNIEHKTVDCRARFKESVICPFVSEYLSAHTPSPCILCNQHVKFPALIEEADKIGAAYIATGHYSRIERKSGRLGLFKATDVKKDQSYFLYRMNREELTRTIFPLGSKSKTEVRQIAEKIKLKIHNKPESQEVCFVPDDDYVAFIEGSAGANLKGPGNFINTKGEVLGRHKGIHAYTIGQRRGLGFGSGKRQYVVRVDIERNEIVLGSNEDLKQQEIVVNDVTWIDSAPYDGAKIGDKIDDGANVSVKIRSTHAGNEAEIEKIGLNTVKVHFKTPIRAPAPGQSAVFYRNDEVLGGGVITL